MRIARTETNMAYRMADNDRWGRLPFVLGQRIQLSHSHPHYDICDELAGVYPKSFVFVGWHPQCFCFSTPVLVSENEILKANKVFAKGEKYTPKGKGVTEMPKAFDKWVKKNKDNIILSRKKDKEPYFLKYNKGIVDKALGISIHGKDSLKLGRNNKKSFFEKDLSHRSKHEYSEAQKQNFIEIEKAVNTKQGQYKNLGDIVDNYTNITKDNENCATCVIVHELRLRGFDVVAKSFSQDKEGIMSKLSENPKIVWVNNKGKIPEYTLIKGSSEKEIIKRIENSTSGIGSRYHLSWDESKEFGHIVTIERTKNGLVIYDPQQNDFLSINEIIQRMYKNTPLQLLRVDNLLFRVEFMNKLAIFK